jgi:glucoamylase
MRTVAELMEDAESPAERESWQRSFEDFVRFSLALSRLDGPAFLRRSRHREATRPESRKHLRDDAEFAALTGDGLMGEPRFNADGSLDFLGWSRPQFDGPALRALACLRYLAAGGPADDELKQLLRRDLDFTLRHADRPCIGPWEEAGEHAHHYHVALVQLGALLHGRPWLEDSQEAWRTGVARLQQGLAQHWSAAHGVYRAIRENDGESADDLVDAAQLIAVLDADLAEGPHSILDPRVQATQAAIEQLFARELPINHGLPPGRGPALGRSRADRYFGGGAWYPTTLAAAALCYRRAALPGQDRNGLVQRGDGFMATVRALTPADGALSEQVDRTTGEQTSARHLTWSYAAFLSTARLRRLALSA